METNYYKTADLALVAVLLLFIPDSLEVVDRGNPHKVLFNELKQVKVRIYAED